MDSQDHLMTTMVEVLPFKHLVKQVELGLEKYHDDPSDESKGYLVFVMQMVMMKYLMEKKGMSGDDMLSDLEKHEKMMNLFKENNN